MLRPFLRRLGHLVSRLSSLVSRLSSLVSRLSSLVSSRPVPSHPSASMSNAARHRSFAWLHERGGLRSRTGDSGALDTMRSRDTPPPDPGTRPSPDDDMTVRCRLCQRSGGDNRGQDGARRRHGKVTVSINDPALTCTPPCWCIQSNASYLGWGEGQILLLPFCRTNRYNETR